MASPVIGDIMAKLHPEGSLTPTEPSGESSDDGLLSCAEDVLVAVKQDDPHALASALKAAFEYLEAQPHEDNEEGA